MAHHCGAGVFGCLAGGFHLAVRPAVGLYILLRMGNIETVLSSSIGVVAWASAIAGGTMWFGSASTPVEVFGPSRYWWDLGVIQSGIETVVQTS